jgi:phosphoglycolate phosphatase-like HAD superfamily hydrolase
MVSGGYALALAGAPLAALVFAMEGIATTRQTNRIFSPARIRAVSTLALPKVLLCDLDGTLVDTMPVLADLATEVMVGMYGIPKTLARELYLATCGLPFVAQLEDIFPGDARNPTASDLFEAAKPARMPADTRAALVELRRRGVRLAVSSNNGRANVESFARTADFSFDLVMGYGGGLSKGRPHVQMVEQVFGVGRGEMLFIGDSLHDGEIAHVEGLSFVGVAGTFSKESFLLRFPGLPVVHRFAELLDLFEVSAAVAAASV